MRYFLWQREIRALNETVSVATAARCYHCQEPLRTGRTHRRTLLGEERQFCCSGCLMACEIILDAGEGSYYENRTAAAPKVRSGAMQADQYDLPELENPYAESEGPGLLAARLDIVGIHCPSCVYLNERLLLRLHGVREAQVDYESGRARVVFEPESVRLSDIVALLASVGYEARPVRADSPSRALQEQCRNLLWRLVVAGFAAGNIMMLSIALWSGYFDGSVSPEFRRLFEWMQFLLATPVYFYCARIFHRGWRGLLRGGPPGMDLLVSAGITSAYAYSIVAFFQGSAIVYFDSVVMIVFFLLVGRYLECRARLRQRERMEALVRPLPETCRRLNRRSLHPDRDLHAPFSVCQNAALRVGDLVLLEPGEHVPADGSLLALRDGVFGVDESVLTGESRPVFRETGARLLAGSVVIEGRAVMRVSANPAESSLAVLARLASDPHAADLNRDRTLGRLIPRFLFGIATIAFSSFAYWYLVAGLDFGAALLPLVAVLIVSCPCALALAAPTARGAAIYLALRHGLLIRDGGVLDRLSAIRNVFFDKTGTLTRGRPTVPGVRLFASDARVRALVEYMEEDTLHPMGVALRESVAHFPEASPAKGRRRTVPGRGILLRSPDGGAYRLGDVRFAAANVRATDRDCIHDFSREFSEHSILALCDRRQVLALFALRDEVRPGASGLIAGVRRSGLQPTMLTGDAMKPARRIGAEIGLKNHEIFARLLPEQKVHAIEEARLNGSGVCMVGDGFNDAPALARADVGVVVSRGAPLSMERAGVVLLHDDPGDLLYAIELARVTRRSVRTNLAISLLYNSVMVPIAAAGLLLPVWCALAMAASSLSVVLSSMFLRMRGDTIWKR
ncbi:MAG: heavy metal translocating P-type ATPase [Spirochaetales bacterium]|nr:heavy metal translocating P-type ATPase [Leptospiraceae bacterium]MCP5481102.1 heavy metal translocating P-type ATPase [Spirochaetales bacterium]